MNISIIGAARSGVAAALLAARQGHTVFVSESRSAEAVASACAELEEHGIAFECGGHSGRVLESELIITSPGVPPTAAPIVQAEQQGISVISELEFGWRHTKSPVIAITGTNGKTTTTSLTAYILEQAGRKALAVGNIGTPLSAVADSVASDTILVVEASSYQLDRITSFAPDVAAILNITPDHLSYHGGFEQYKRAKWNIFLHQNEKNIVILNTDDQNSYAAAEIARSRVFTFGTIQTQQGMVLRDNALFFHSPEEEEFFMNIQDIRIPGYHNVYNSMAAAIAARAFEIRNENIRDSLMAFRGVEHRIELTRTIDGVEFYNDSKATNVNATWYALGSFRKPIVWIAGGRGDNNDYSALNDIVRQNVECIVAIGEEKDAIFSHFSATTRCIIADSLEQAVATAYEHAPADGVVLFSPACKSFDMFANYEHRGEVFKHIVNSL